MGKKNQTENFESPETQDIDHYEYDEEVFESWGAHEETTFPFKPVIGSIVGIIFLGAVGLFYFQYRDPASVWDRTDELDTSAPSEETVKHATLNTKSAEPKPTAQPLAKAPDGIATAEAKIPSAPTVPDAKEPAIPENAPSATAPEPVVETETAPSPAPMQPEVAASDGYEQLLETAKKARGMRNRVEAFTKALEANPGGHEALAELAFLLMDTRKRMDEALDYATRSTEIEPDNATAWLARGYILQIKNQHAEAKAAYKKCADSTGPKKYVSECRRM